MTRAVNVGYARHIGRVGALAVALGVGVAVATGTTGPAWAQTDSTGGSQGTEGQSQTSPQTGSETDTTKGTGDPATDPGSDGVGDEGSDVGTGDKGDAGTEVSASGVDTSDNDAGQATDGSGGTASDGADGADGRDGRDGDSADVLKPGDDGESAPAGSKTAPIPAPNNNTHAEGQSPALSPPEENVASSHVVDTDVKTATVSHLMVSPSAGTSGTGTNHDASARVMATAAVVDQPAPDPTQALLAIPNAVISVVTTFVGALLSPFFAPGPSTPAEPPFVWALLGWVGREIQRTFFNSSPQAVTDEVTTSEDATDVKIDVLDNDVDLDEDTLTVTQATALHGTVSVNDDGTLAYTPNADYNGADTITYTISDAGSGWHIHGLGGLLSSLFGGDGGHAATGTVNVDVKAVNDAPVAGDDTATTAEDTPVKITVLANDSDVDGDTLTISSTAPGVVVNADKTITYTPAANTNGTQTFTYTVSDGTLTDTATVTVTVTPVPDAPVGVQDSYTTPEDTAVTIAAPGVLGNDTDGDNDVLTATIGTSPAHGGVTLNDDGSFTYTPAKDFNGTDSFTYTASDGTTSTAPVTVAITVTPVNDKPVAKDDTAVTDEDTSVTINVLTNDSDVDGDALKVTTTAAGAVVNADNTITYTPALNSTGDQSFSYTIDDSHGGTASATVTVHVTPVDDAPVAVGDSYSIDEDGVLHVVAADGVLANDSDVDGPPLKVLENTLPTNGGLTVASDGSFTYTPAKDFNGDDSFKYTIGDVDHQVTATVTIHVIAKNDPPVAKSDDATTTEDTPVTINVLTNDSDVDGDALKVTTTAAGAVVNADNTITYTPAANTNGEQTFSYTIDDSHGGTASAIVTVHVTPVDDAPVAETDRVTTGEGAPITIDVLANDGDVDGDVLVVQPGSIDVPQNGTATLTADGKILYTPDAGFVGIDNFSYNAFDGTKSDTAIVFVTVTAVNHAPVAETDRVTTGEGAPITIDVLANDGDVDGDVLVVEPGSISLPQNGTVTLTADGNILYTPVAGFVGDDTFSYNAFDGTTSDTALVFVTVTAAAAPSLAVGDPTDINPNTEQRTYQVTTTGLDPATVTLTGVPQHGTFVDNGDGTFSYKPDRTYVKTLEPVGNRPAQDGTDTFTVTGTDASGKTATAQVTASVHYIESAPILQVIVDHDGTSDDPVVTGHIVFDSVDINGDPVTLTFGPVLQQNKGRLTYDAATKIFTFTPSDAARSAANPANPDDPNNQVLMILTIADGFRKGTVNTGVGLTIAPFATPSSDGDPVLQPPGVGGVGTDPTLPPIPGGPVLGGGGGEPELPPIIVITR